MGGLGDHPWTVARRVFGYPVIRTSADVYPARLDAVRQAGSLQREIAELWIRSLKSLKLNDRTVYIVRALWGTIVRKVALTYRETSEFMTLLGTNFRDCDGSPVSCTCFYARLSPTAHYVHSCVNQSSLNLVTEPRS
jgi:hypothetical protein